MNYQGLMEITKIENIADDVYEMTLKGEGAKYISQPGQDVYKRQLYNKSYKFKNKMESVF